MDESSIGIVTGIQPLTDSSLIIRWLSRDFGRVDTVAKGARKPKSSFAGLLDLYYLCEFAMVRGKHSQLHTLKEVQLIEPREGLSRDFQWLRQAAYAADFIRVTTEHDTPIPEFFELLSGFLSVLPSRPPSPLNILAFEWRALDLLGLSPPMNSPRITEDVRILADWLGRTEWQSLDPAQAPPGAADFAKRLGVFMERHMEHQPKHRAEALLV